MRLDRRILQLLVSVAGIAIITWIAYVQVPVNATTVGFAYLLFVLVVASTWGFLEAAVSSISATLAFNYFFLDPTLTFTIASPENWVALFSFLTTALIASRLSTRARRRTMDALDRQRDLERLYTFGRSILLFDDGEPVGKQLVRRMADIFELDAAALYERRTGEIHRAGPLDFKGMDSQLREAALQGTEFTGPAGQRVVTAVRLGSQPIASLALQGTRMPDSVLQSVSNLVAIGLERSRAQDLAHEVEAARRSERLRTTLLDAMAHEFKTPLTSIRAATSALLSKPGETPAGAMRILKIADEEAAHLDELIDNALDMAQLDSDHIDVDLEISSLPDVVREVVDPLREKVGEDRLEFAAEEVPLLSVDRRLIKVAIKQLVDNALKYSPSNAPVSIRAFPSDGTVAVDITDHGKGITESEQARIFERFYRSPADRDQFPGSGLGLSIALRILQAHGGDITLKSRPGETTFRLVFPVVRNKGEKR